MKVGEIAAPRGARKRRKIVGRGQRSGHGKTSCRGHKGSGQHACRGGKRFDYEGGQMPLFRRLPKQGFRNPDKKEFQIVNLSSLAAFDQGQDVTPAVLRQKGVIRSATVPVKILGNGTLEKRLTVTAHAFSRSAREAVEKAGGTVTVLTR